MNYILDSNLLNKYKKDLKKCDKLSSKKEKCIETVNTTFLRKMPNMKNLVYPWKNYDWAYDTYVDKHYNKNKTGATPDGTFSALFKNPKAMFKIMGGFLLNANPNKGDKAGISDNLECNGDKNCEIIKNIKKINQPPPYKDPFFNKNLNGKNSSSYYIQTGVCIKPKLTKKDCIKKGYNWIENPLFIKTPKYLRSPTFISGTCFKPRYGYINNKSGFNIKLPKSTNKSDNIASNIINKNSNKFEGLIPSFINDLSGLSPNNIYKISQGKSTNDFTIMNCEDFCNYNRQLGITNEQYIYISIILIFFIMLIILYFVN